MAHWDKRAVDSFGGFQGIGAFGVALDVSDDPWTLDLKRASIDVQHKVIEGVFADPYEAVLPGLVAYNQFIDLIGRFPVPSWLSPRPLESDLQLVNSRNMRMYLAQGGLYELLGDLYRFVKRNVLPRKPIMIGVDHSATGAVIMALSQNLGPQNLGVVVLDQHFDGLPISLRIEADSAKNLGMSGGDRCCSSEMSLGEEYCCGNFWKYLMDAGTVLPENLLFVGVADYPPENPGPGWDRFRKSYLAFRSRGCNFFPLDKFEGGYIRRLKTFIENHIRVPNVYVSLDLDVGAYSCVLAARYMDRPGIKREALMDVARVIAGYQQSGRFQLVGLDVMEFNTHFLGIETNGGDRDETISVALSFIKELFL